MNEPVTSNPGRATFTSCIITTNTPGAQPWYIRLDDWQHGIGTGRATWWREAWWRAWYPWCRICDHWREEPEA